MELLYLYVHNDKKSIKGCEYNFSPNYKFTYNAATKTLHTEWHRDNLPHKWFGENILNMTAIIGKNASGKTNLIECIIKSLCGWGGGWIIYLHEGQLYTNVPILYPDIEIQTRIRHIVEVIIGRKSANENASIQDLENKIDFIVYHLYYLTYDEVLIVDPQTPISRKQYKSFNL